MIPRQGVAQRCERHLRLSATRSGDMGMIGQRPPACDTDLLLLTIYLSLEFFAAVCRRELQGRYLPALDGRLKSQPTRPII